MRKLPPTRREFLLGTGALLAGCRNSPSADRAAAAAPEERVTLDAVLGAHASVWPEKRGAGANHDPMAAEALEALGRAEAIPASWVRRARSYAGEERQAQPIADWSSELGRYERYPDWRAFFARELAEHAWSRVVARWAPRLAPGLSGALFHGLLRTAHAARAAPRGDAGAPRRARLRPRLLGRAREAAADAHGGTPLPSRPRRARVAVA